MNQAQAHQLLDNGSWRFAKTMPETPHEYILRPNYDPATWTALVIWLKENSKFERWKGNIWYSYYYYNGHKYFTLDAPPHKTGVINRAKV